MKKGRLWGGKSFFEMPGEKCFWGEIENFRFCLGGELTLDDTMTQYWHMDLMCLGETEFKDISGHFKENTPFFRTI